MTTTTAAPAVDSPSAAVDRGGASGPGAWLRLVVGSLCQSAVATLVFFALWAALPALIGWEPTTVSSGSMMPRLRVGDVAVAKPLGGAPALQQVLLFDDPDHRGRLRLHRFVRVDDQGRMVTRGDANETDDSSPVTQASVRGVAVLRVPGVALPVVWLREGRWVELGLAAGALVLVLAGSRLPQGAAPRPSGPRDPGPGSGPGAGGPAGVRRGRSRSGSRRRRTSPVTATVAVTTLLGIAGLVAAAPAWASYTGSTTNPDSSYASAPFYRCSSAVLPQSPFLYYELDETSGTSLADSSTNGRTGTLVGPMATSSSNVCTLDSSTGVQLNGSTSYISTPAQVSAPNTFTLQAWFKTTTGRGGRIAGFGNARTGASTNADRMIYMSDSGGLSFGVQTGNNQRPTISTATGASYNDGAWHLVTASLSTAGMRLYVDGALVASRPSTTTGIVYTGYWRFGYDALPASWSGAPTSTFFAGTLKQVAVYPTALSAQAISTIHDAGRA